MKNEVSGVAGAARINQMTRADLTRAEQHGKRLDRTGQSRAITETPPITTTGLDLNAQFEKHIAGAFVPKAHSKAMHMLIQFPTDLVDGNDATGMLRHARSFTERVFGDAAIFADRIDRDERSQHVVDVFVAPKYTKRTKHQSKTAVSMTHHLKALATEYGHPTGPHGCARALQDALFEYLRDEMGLVGVRRGSPKPMPGPDWKSAEQLRAEELNELAAQARAGVDRIGQDQARARADQAAAAAALAEAARIVEQTGDERRAAHDDRARAAEQHRQAQEDREAAAQVARRTDEDRRAAAAERAAAQAMRMEQEAATVRQQRELVGLRVAAAADRDAAERQRAATDDARAAMIAARDRAETDAAVASLKRQDADIAAAAVDAEREAIAATRRDLDERRRIEVAQMALLARAADDRTGMNLRLAGDSFAIGPHGLNDEDQALRAKGWSRALIAMARGLAQALDRVRTLARDLARRERAAEQQAADLKARDAALAQDRAAHDARVTAHQRAVADLDRRRAALDADETRVIAAAAAAEASARAASATQATADAVLQDHRRWIEVMDTLETRPDWVEVGPGGTLVLDRHAAAASPMLAKAFERPPPAWVVSLAVQRLDLADALQRADERERIATYAAERLTDMLAKAGPVLTPAQQKVSDNAAHVLRRFGPARDDPGR